LNRIHRHFIDASSQGAYDEYDCIPIAGEFHERGVCPMNPIPAGPGHAITTLASREVYRNHWMRVREDEILRSNGVRGIYGVVEKHDAAIILPSARWNCRKAAGRWKLRIPKSWRAANSKKKPGWKPQR
jgi:hypothetical protein